MLPSFLYSGHSRSSWKDLEITTQVGKKEIMNKHLKLFIKSFSFDDSDLYYLLT